MSVFLGIDFGSSTCRTVFLRDGAFEVVSNRFDERGLPPVTPMIEAPSMKTGLGDNGFPVAFRSLKQELGNLQPVVTAVGIHNVAEKIGEVLGQIREDVSGTIGEAVAGAVLGIPGFYTDSPRAALRDAAHSAGFSAVRLIDEGVAAILGAAQPVDRGTVLVYALGSGVFSATVAVVENGRPRVVSAEGNRFLGGSHLDIALASVILKRLGLGVDFVDPKGSSIYLKKLAADIKIGLSRREEELFDVNLTELFGTGGITPLVVKRSEFEEAISEPVDLTLELTRKAVEGAGASAAGLDFIVTVGDSTRIPLIETRLSAEYCAQRMRAANTDVAKGAALFGGQVREGNWKRRGTTVVAPAAPVPAIAPRATVRPQEPGTWVANFTPHLLEAEKKWKAGDKRGAIRTFEGIVRDAGGFLATLYHSEGQGLFRDGNYDEAVDVLGKAVQCTLDPDDLDRFNKDYHVSLNHRAIQLVESGRLDEAWFTIRKALEIDRGCEGCTKLAERVRQALKTAGPERSKKRKR
jgi:actin-like ATPase involved in cell morphogenesis